MGFFSARTYDMACPTIPWQIFIIILYIISGLTLVVFGIIGIAVALVKSERGLLFFGGAMGIMFGFQMVQIIIATVALANCDRDSLLTALCETNQFLYYIHVFIVLIVCLLLCVLSFILRKILISAHEDEDNYY